MGLVYEVYLVEEGDSVFIGRTYSADRLLEALKELLRYLITWESAREGLQIKINIYEKPEKPEGEHEA
jgi:hypothetical protein